MTASRSDSRRKSGCWYVFVLAIFALPHFAITVLAFWGSIDVNIDVEETASNAFRRRAWELVLMVVGFPAWPVMMSASNDNPLVAGVLPWLWSYLNSMLWTFCARLGFTLLFRRRPSRSATT